MATQVREIPNHSNRSATRMDSHKLMSRTIVRPDGCPPLALGCRLTAVIAVLASQACGDHKKAGGIADGAVPDVPPDLWPAADTAPLLVPPSDARPDAVVLAGEAGALEGARLTLAPASTNFGTIDPGTGVSIQLRIENLGDAASGEITITHSPELTTDQSIQRPLLPGEMSTLLVRVTTTGEGAINGWVAIAADPGATPAVQATVTGVFAPWGPFMVWPREFDLGTVAYGSELLRTTTVTMRESVTDLTMKPNGSYATIDPSTTCTAQMDAGATCTVVVKLVVSQTGSVSDVVLITATGTRRKTSVVSIRAVGEISP
jgi:hypothetical protein